MLHSDQSCPDIPVRPDSRIDTDPGDRKIENEASKSHLAGWFPFSFN